MQPANRHRAGGREVVPGTIEVGPAGHHRTRRSQVVPRATDEHPPRRHRTRGGIQVVPGAVHVGPACHLRARSTVVEPLSTLKGPSGHHVAARVETVGRPVDLSAHRRRVAAILVAVPPANRVLHPRASLGLVNLIHAGRHRIERIKEAVTAVLPAIDGRVEAPVIGRRLLLHEVDDLRAGQLRMHRLDEGRDARHVRRRHRRAVSYRVTARVEQQGNRGVNLVARSSKIDRVAVIRELGATEGQPGLHVVRLADRAHLRDAVKHGGNADTAVHGPVLRRRGHVGRGSVIDRRIVNVDALVTGRRDHGQTFILRILDGSRRRLEARRLLGVGRAPIDPRIHRVRVVHDIDPMARSPHERARHILGVDETIIVRRLNGDNARLRSNTINADIVVIGRNNARDVRAVIELVTPPIKILSRNAVHRTLHGTRRIDAPLQVRMSVLNAGINDGDGHRRTLDIHGLSLARMHGDRTPVENLLVCTSGGGARALLTHGGQPACRAGLRALVLLVCG